MISEKDLVTSYAHLWRTLCPLMDEYVREINSIGRSKFAPTIDTLVVSSRRTLVAEAAIKTFRDSLSGEPVPARTVSPSLTNKEHEESEELAARLHRIAKKNAATQVIIDPGFPGCGYLNACSADLIVDNVLYEIKIVDRSYRSIDLRQLIVYAMLNYASERYDISYLGLVNPRLGTLFVRSVDDLISRVALAGTREVFDRLIYVLSSSELST